MTRLRRYKTILSPIVFTCKEHTLLLSCFPTDNRGGGFHQDPRKFLIQKTFFQLHWETRDSRKINYIVECVGPQKQTITRDWFHLKSCNTSAQLAKNIKEEKKKKESPTSTTPSREGSPVLRTSSTVHQRSSRCRATAVKGSEGENNARIFCLPLDPYRGAKLTLALSIGV